MKSILQISVPPEMVPYMERHGKRALRALEQFAADGSTIDEKLGALGVMAQMLLAYGDSLRAIQLAKTDNAPRA